MHYYKRNLGDYAKKAGRLSMLQHGAYTLLLDACYDREQFPTIDEAIEWTWASTEAEIEAVKFVLSRFFTPENGVYVQARVREELDGYAKKAHVNQRIAHDRETARRDKDTVRARTVHEPCTNRHLTKNQEPRTTNQDEKEKIKEKRCAALAPPDGVSKKLWDDFSALRKLKKAPLTQTALDGINREAAKAGVSLETALATCCEAGWQGFSADWYARRHGGAPPQIAPVESFAERDSRVKRQAWEQMTGQRWPDADAPAKTRCQAIDVQTTEILRQK